MGDLIEIPYSKLTATLELLARHGVNIEDFKNLRKASTWKQGVVARVIKDESFLWAILAIEQLALKVGFTEADFKKLAGDEEEMRELLVVYRNRSRNELSSNLIHLILPSMLTKPSWSTELLEDPESQLAGQSVTLDLVEFLQPGEILTSSETMVSRSKEKGDLAGRRSFEALYQNRHRIPEEWRRFILVFPGTTWRDGDGGRYVQCLCGGGGEWCRLRYWLGDGFGSACRVVVVRACKQIYTLYFKL